MSKRALEGIKVIEYASFISGPYATKLMADLGAEVIKIEVPGEGDSSRNYGPFSDDTPSLERSGLFLWLNANKLGVTLNLQKATGKAIFEELIKSADVLIENNPPKVVKELGINYEHLRKVNPRLIMTSITPFGQTGPYKDYKAYEINCCAAGGASIGTGEPGREPITPPLFLSSFQAGANAVIATLYGLLMRESMGRGQHIDISEAEVLATLYTGRYMVLFMFIGITGLRKGRHAGYFLYPIATLPCKDGYMCLMAPQVEQWIRFTEIMGSPEWTKTPRFRDRRAMVEQYPEEADALLLPWLKSRTKEEIFALCRQHHIPFAPVRTIDEVVNDPHLKARNFFLGMNHPEAGWLKYPGFPYKLSKTPCAIERPAPRLGEHNEAIFCGRLGYSKEKLVRLQQTGII